MIKNLLIIAQSILITVKYSCLAIYRSFSYSRSATDLVVYNWSKALLKAVHASVRIHNPHHVSLKSNHPYVLMSNHTSLYDIPIIFMTFPDNSIRMIAKKELFKVPLWGHAMKTSEFVAVDRKNSTQAIKDLEEVQQKMKSGIIPWIAPEGTRSRDGKLGPFKKGGFMLAIQTHATIIPIAIKGAANILPPKTMNFQTHQTVDVVIGKPVDASQYSVKNRMALLQEVHKQIKDILIQE